MNKTSNMDWRKINFRVRYHETDRMGVVYYSNYLVWFEMGRTEFFRGLSLDYRELEDERGIFLPVVEASCRYRRPVKYDDVVSISTRLTAIARARITFDYEVTCGSLLCASGTTVHAFIDQKRSPIPVPEDIREKMISEA